MKIRASIGSLGLLELREIKVQAKPTTLYLMVNERCIYNCGYCPQARTSRSTSYDKLSRVIWPEIEWDILKKALTLKANLYERICFQVVNGENYLQHTLHFLREIKFLKLSKPVSVSIRLRTLEELESIFYEGTERVGLPIDIASKEMFSRIRGGSFDYAKSVILEAVKKYPGRITTHIIVGLGENDKEVYQLMKEFNDSGVLVSLFAFTPVTGTPLEKQQPPKISRYRRIQLLRYLITKGETFEAGFDAFGNLLHIDLEDGEIVKNPLIYMTSGCPGCNRPYYNETPTGPMFNFPFKPDVSEDILGSYIENAKGRRITFKED